MTVVYKTNFLTNVIFRMDFSPILTIEDKVKSFHSLIGDVFPILEPVVSQQLMIEAEGDNLPKAEKISQTMWQFKNKEESYQCNLTQESVILLVNKYTSFTDLRKIFDLVIDSFIATYTFPSIKRIGLRYINEISLPEKDFFKWEGFINPSLMANLSFPEDQKSIRRSMNRMELKVDDETLLAVSSGIFNSSYPAELINKEFVLDFDCYSRTSKPSNKEEIVSQISRYNDIITASFERSIEQNLRDIMNI